MFSISPCTVKSATSAKKSGTAAAKVPKYPTLEPKRRLASEPISRSKRQSTIDVACFSRMLDYLAGFYQSSSSMVVAMAGDIQHEEAVAEVNRFTRNWSNQKPHKNCNDCR
jgi:hypothetical protein